MNARTAFGLVAALCIPVGLSTKLFRGGDLAWIAAHLGGAFYVIFWSLAVLTLRPRARARNVAFLVGALTCGVEFLQLYETGWLQTLRGTTCGALLLGTTFTWTDFPFYFLGVACSWALGARIQSRALHAPEPVIQSLSTGPDSLDQP